MKKINKHLSLKKNSKKYENKMIFVKMEMLKIEIQDGREKNLESLCGLDFIDKKN